MNQLEGQEADDQAQIHLWREAGGWTDRLRAYRVFLDGREVGAIRTGEVKTFGVDAGSHDVYLKVDWARSPVVQLDLVAREEAHLRCSPAASAATALFSALLQPHRYIRLDRTDAGGVPKDGAGIKRGLRFLAALILGAWRILNAVLILGYDGRSR